MVYTMLRVSEKDIMRIAMALANDPNRPTLTQENQQDVKEFLDLTARLQQARKRFAVENGANATKQSV